MESIQDHRRERIATRLASPTIHWSDLWYIFVVCASERLKLLPRSVDSADIIPPPDNGLLGLTTTPSPRKKHKHAEMVTIHSNIRDRWIGSEVTLMDNLYPKCDCRAWKQRYQQQQYYSVDHRMTESVYEVGGMK